MVQVRHLGPINDSDIQNAWYKEDDYNAFKSDNIRIVKKLQTIYGTGSSLILPTATDNEIEECTRGLEIFSRRLAMRREKRRRRAAMSVFTLQTQQQSEGKLDAAAIAAAYAEHTVKSKHDAASLGKTDEEYVRDQIKLEALAMKSVDCFEHEAYLSPGTPRHKKVASRAA